MFSTTSDEDYCETELLLKGAGKSNKRMCLGSGGETVIELDSSSENEDSEEHKEEESVIEISPSINRQQ